MSVARAVKLWLLPLENCVVVNDHTPALFAMVAPRKLLWSNTSTKSFAGPRPVSCTWPVYSIVAAVMTGAAGGVVGPPVFWSSFGPLITAAPVTIFKLLYVIGLTVDWINVEIDW